MQDNTIYDSMKCSFSVPNVSPSVIGLLPRIPETYVCVMKSPTSREKHKLQMLENEAPRKHLDRRKMK
jgi:hypothetical protein